MSGAGSSSDIESQIIGGLNQALPIVETIVGIVFPGAETTASLALKIAQGVLAGVPEAIALYEQFKAGTPPTQEELDAYIADENSAYAKLMADIDAKLAG